MNVPDTALSALAAISLRWPVRDADCLLLVDLGLVSRDGGEWVLTEAGEEFLLAQVASMRVIKPPP